jgi:hypothetical protein
MITYSGENTTCAHKWAKQSAEEEGITKEEWLKNNTPADTKDCIQKVTFFDVQWSSCPVEVENVVKQLWRLYELGNDHYMLRRSINDLIELNDQEFEVDHWDDKLWAEEKKGWRKVPLKVDILIEYLRSRGIPDDEEIIIHWWW